MSMRAAGVGASQVYHFFGDKRSLAEAVIAYNTDAVLATVRPRLGQSDSMDVLRA
jgi:AcrR family transcriptional regulator